MAKVILGKVAISWKGTYDNLASYSAQDVVVKDNQCYICTTDGTTGQTPPNNSWELFTNSPINSASNEFDLICKDENGNLLPLPIGIDDTVLGIDYFTRSPAWQPLRFQLGSRIQRFASEFGQDITESSCFAVDTNDRLRAWGNNAHYHLGIGSNTSNEMLPIHVAFPQDFPGVSKLYTSNQTYLGVIDNDGKWWVWGKGSASGFVGSSISTDIYKPTCLSLDNTNSIYSLSIAQSTQKVEVAGDNYNNLLLDTNGQVHFVGSSDHFYAAQPNYINYSTIFSLPTMKQIAATGFQQNATYYMLSNSTGEVWAFGYGSNGERGDAAFSAGHAAITKISSLSNIDKIYGAPGQAYAICSTGELYSWVKNNVGQLGVNDTANRNVPTLSPVFDGTTRKAVSVYYNNGSTYRTTIVTSTNSSNTDHKTHFCGNAFGSVTNNQAFTEISGLNGKIVTHVACVGGNGSTNTITALFLTSTNELYVIGFGTYGQIGDGEGTTRQVLQRFRHIGKDIKIVDIHGFGHDDMTGFCLLDENGRLFYMGSGLNMKSADDDSFDKFTLQEIVF